jgi:uncharacterized protein (TIGR04255 family)
MPCSAGTGIVARRYDHPPVTEALVEVFFAGSEWDATIPGVFYERIRDRFPKKRQLDEVGVEIQLGPEQSGARVRSSDPRVQFLRDDDSRMVQLGRDLLVVNQLRPYPAFEEWRPVAVEMLSLYKELARPAAVNRIGVRYINRIVVPHTIFPIEEYFRLYPEVPEDLAPMHGPFLLRLEIPTRHDGHKLLVTMGSSMDSREAGSGILLDLYDIVEMPGLSVADAFALFEARLDEAHEHIEHAFEMVITDASRALFAEVR